MLFVLVLEKGFISSFQNQEKQANGETWDHIYCLRPRVQAAKSNDTVKQQRLDLDLAKTNLVKKRQIEDLIPTLHKSGVVGY
jgi:hypothetical protein